MLIGLGLDLVSIARIERAMRRPRFVERVLTPLERDYCRTPTQVAGRWAAKEAVAKAVGRPLGWHDVEVLPDDRGRPVARTSAGVLAPGWRLHVSISHETTHAAAVAVLEDGPGS